MISFGLAAIDAGLSISLATIFHTQYSENKKSLPFVRRLMCTTRKRKRERTAGDCVVSLSDDAMMRISTAWVGGRIWLLSIFCKVGIHSKTCYADRSRGECKKCLQVIHYLKLNCFRSVHELFSDVDDFWGSAMWSSQMLRRKFRLCFIANSTIVDECKFSFLSSEATLESAWHIQKCRVANAPRKYINHPTSIEEVDIADFCSIYRIRKFDAQKI